MKNQVFPLPVQGTRIKKTFNLTIAVLERPGWNYPTRSNVPTNENHTLVQQILGNSPQPM